MSSLTSLEKRYFEDLLGLSTGYVLDFTNDSFAEFFQDTVKIEIYSNKYAINGDSKAKRLRSFWETESDALVGKVLESLVEFWKYENSNKGNHPAESVTYMECEKTISRLLGKPYTPGDTEVEFLKQNFGETHFLRFMVDPALVPIIDSRIKEAVKGLKTGMPLSVIFLCGSTLEGITFNR